MRISDWSSDVCSSDLLHGRVEGGGDEIFGGDAGAALHRPFDVALLRDAPAVGGQRRCQRGVDAVARDRGAAGLEDGGEAVERAVRRPPVARDRRDPAVMPDDITNVARRAAGPFGDSPEPRPTRTESRTVGENG